jgi:hypothetical protein
MQIQAYYSREADVQVWFPFAPQQDFSKLPTPEKKRLGNLSPLGIRSTNESAIVEVLEKQGYYINEKAVAFGQDRL